LAHEIVTLAGRLIYRLKEDNVQSLIPSKYTIHLYTDLGSTEVLILSSNHTTTTKGKILVLFRGTDETLDGDWLTNINLPKVLYGPKGAILKATALVPDFFGNNVIHEVRLCRFVE